MPFIDYNNSVFINCPFDDHYTPVLRAIVYAVYRCGFFPKSSLSEDNGLDNRLDKIAGLISNCKYGIHDISRTELNNNNLPRFNMPFELGIFFGAKKLGNKVQKNKNAIIFDIERYRYQEFISDLNGIDIKEHNNDPLVVIQEVRHWLLTASKRTTIPGFVSIRNEFNELMINLPAIVENAGLELDNLSFNDFCYIVEEAIKNNL